MGMARGIEITGEGPGVSGWIVEFREVPRGIELIGAPGREHPAIGQKSNCVGVTRSYQAPAARPRSQRGIVKLSAGQFVVRSGRSASNKDLAVRKHRRGMVAAALIQATCCCPLAIRWIVKLGAGEN